ncbi:transposase [Acidovorax sp. SUPP3334]|uniref:IS66-like element accessory protein TnpA n=1 Tax=Acidovorax sp. SUPP3334 TaxID=2920881 RepID=UPI0023DE2604|nr:transposase [Acidovorax sp. SUPP3334]GKT25019.1 transposase [Acidovorax sp. SUPP3334]
MEDLIEREPVDHLQPGVLSNGKRICAEAFKDELVRQCQVPGTSVAATGLAHGINANLLRRWIAQSGARARAPVSRPTLLPVTLREQPAQSQPSASPVPSPQSIEIEVHGAKIRLHGSVDAQRLGVVLDALALRT